MVKCPACGWQVEMRHDAWEDMYICPRNECRTFWHPEEIGLETDKSAGIFHIGEVKA